jgi:hypothetical protein
MFHKATLGEKQSNISNTTVNAYSARISERAGQWSMLSTPYQAAHSPLSSAIISLLFERVPPLHSDHASGVTSDEYACFQEC